MKSGAPARSTSGRERLPRQYHAYIAGRFISVAGDGMTQVAMPFLVYQATGSVTSVGIVQAARWLPALAMSLIGGVLADRYRRRTLFIVTDLGAGAALVVFAIAIGDQARVHTGLLCVIAAVLGICAALRNPALGGLLTEIVPPHQRQRAVSWAATTRSCASLLGPVAGGLAMAGLGASVTVAIDAATFLVGVVLFSVFITSDTVEISQGGLISAAREGWRYVLDRRWMWTTIGFSALFQLLYLPTFFVLGPVWVVQSGRSAAFWGVLMAVFGAGNVLGSWLPSRARTPIPLVAVWLTLAAAPVATVALAWDRGPWLALVAFALSGVAVAFSDTVWMTMLTLQVPSTLISRVLAIDGFGSMLLKPLGQTGVGILAATVATDVIMTQAAAAVCLLGVTGAALFARPGAVPNRGSDDS